MKRLVPLMMVGLVVLPAKADEIDPYVYAGVGLSRVNFAVNKNSIPTLTTAAEVNANSYNLNLFAGYQFDRLLGMELNYLGSGAVTATDQGQTRKLFGVELAALSATFKTKLNDSVDLYAKLGGASWNFSPQQGLEKSDGFGPCLGLGADINLYGGGDRKMRLEYSYYHLDKVYMKSANTLSISAVFNFPVKTSGHAAAKPFGDDGQRRTGTVSTL
jgi:hypothetical protein